MVHITKDGTKIKFSDLKTDHLENILKMIERRAIRGLGIRMGGGTTDEDSWYDEEIVYGEEAKEQLNYYEYKEELSKRTK